MSSNQIALKNLVSMETLSNEEVMALIKRGIEFKNGAKVHYDEQHIVSNLFFEPSTRTHKAFEVAELKLGCDLLDFDVKTSSVNKGETIIEKLLRHFNSETDYCVVLLTPDDLGKGANDPKLMPRARQNVILELGFAMGVIGRNRIAILCDPSIEIPSDILGLGYIEYRRDTKDQSWKFRLYDEFLDAGVLN